MSEEVLLYERVGKVGKVILNRPKEIGRAHV